MSTRRCAFALILGLVALAPAIAQTSSAWRWAGAGDGYYGLQPGRGASLPRCNSFANACTVNIPLLEKTAAGTEWKLVGRLGSAARPSPLTTAEGGTGLAYGIGLSWDLTPSTSATVGFDSYDYRFAGERDAVRATSLGLQWRY